MWEAICTWSIFAFLGIREATRSKQLGGISWSRPRASSSAARELRRRLEKQPIEDDQPQHIGQARLVTKYRIAVE